MFIHVVAKALEEEGVSYAIVGGYAVALLGAVRGTADVDIALSWSLKNLMKAEKALKKIGLISLLPVEAQSVFDFRAEYIEKRNMIAWHFYDPTNPTKQVDIVINYNLKPGTYHSLKTVGGPLKILSKKALIAMKKAAGRPQDIADVKALETL